MQPGRRVFAALYIHKAPLRALDDTGRHHQAIAHRPHHLGHRKARQHRLQQLAAQAVKRDALQDGGERFRVLGALGIILDARLHLPGLADQRQLALLQAIKHISIALEITVQLHTAIAALQQQRVIGAQHPHVVRLERVAQPVGKF